MAPSDVLALDVGGTFLKAGYVVDGRVRDVVRVRVPQFLDLKGELGEMGHAREIDAPALDTVIATAISQLGAVVSKCRIFISGQMAGIAFVDNYGKALAPLVTWQDTRFFNANTVAAELGSEVIANLGERIRVGSPVVTLSGLDRPRDSNVTSLLGYVAGRLAKVRARVVHATDAGSWGMLDVRNLHWSQAACTVARVSPESLPRVSMSVEPVSSGASVMVGVGDQQAALLGAGLQPGWLSVNLATGCQVSMLTDEFGVGEQIRPYFGATEGGRYLRTETHLPGGRLLTAAVLAARGRCSEADWEWVAAEGHADPGITAAINSIVLGVFEGARRIRALAIPVLFSGGLVQRLPLLRYQLVSALGAPKFAVFDGNDAALAGLAVISATQEC